METQKPTIVQALKGGLISGGMVAVLNSIWNLIAQSMGIVPPPNFTVAIIMASIVPIMFGAIIYFLLRKFILKGTLIFTIVGAIFALVSLSGPMQPQMPDGSPTPEGFAMLTIPMHIVAGGLALWGIPKFSK